MKFMNLVSFGIVLIISPLADDVALKNHAIQLVAEIEREICLPEPNIEVIHREIEVREMEI
jgi:hypothetical protein